MSNGNTIERISDDFNVMWQGIAQDLNLDVDPEYATKGKYLFTFTKFVYIYLVCLLLLSLLIFQLENSLWNFLRQDFEWAAK